MHLFDSVEMTELILQLLNNEYDGYITERW